MKTFTIELTASEIEALQICLCAERMILEEEVTRLENHNNTGINTHKINLKRNCMKVCDNLWDKLYEVENNRG